MIVASKRNGLWSSAGLSCVQEGGEAEAFYSYQAGATWNSCFLVVVISVELFTVSKMD